MLFGEYRFTCELETDATLPPYKGSTFRGVFGRALKQVVCALKHQECAECLLNQKCVYAQVFELPAPLDAKDSRIAARPHPFVIEPPLSTETSFSAGSSFDFVLMLMGEANQFLPYFIYAFEQMGKLGIGRKENGHRGQFLLKEVTAGTAPIYTSDTRKLNINSAPDNLDLAHVSAIDQDQDIRLRVTMETPLRLKFDNCLQADLPFHVMVRAMLRRMSSLMNAYGGGEPNIDYRGLIKQAESVRTVENHLHWLDWRRYSFRQDTGMLMGGMIGSVIYEGRIGVFLPILEFCEKVHLGKQTTFGLGKIKIERLS